MTWLDKLKKYFFNGFIIILPLIVTIYLVKIIFSIGDSVLAGPVSLFLGQDIPGIGFILTVGLILTIGFFSTSNIFKQLVGSVEKWVLRLPFVNTIYSNVKHLNDLVFMQSETNLFRQVCAVEYPSEGIYSMGFVTGDGLLELKEKLALAENMVSIFVPTSPSPATGFFIMVPASKVIFLNITLEQAFKMIVSGGVLTPTNKISQVNTSVKKENTSE